jgi:hypothetical protein
VILAVDQGTSSTKATLFDRTGAAVTSASVPLGQAHPRPGWVQQDAGEILDGVRQVIAEIAASHEIEAVALSTQRESALVWDRATGEPVGPMLGWQDRRTSSSGSSTTSTRTARGRAAASCASAPSTPGWSPGSPGSTGSRRATRRARSCSTSPPATGATSCASCSRFRARSFPASRRPTSPPVRSTASPGA